MKEKIRVLFVCIHNSARSQMAEKFLNVLGNGLFEAESAGIEPGNLNPIVVKAMLEVNLDISKNKTKSVFDIQREGRSYNFVITVCDPEAAERCPLFPGKTQREHWGFKDPSSFNGTVEEKLEFTRAIRDAIKDRVNTFINEHI